MSRIDWFQDEESVTLTIYEPQVLEESVKLVLKDKSLRVLFNSQKSEHTQCFEIHLNSEIKNPSEGNDNLRVSCTEKKLEVKLFKKEAGMWDDLESNESKEKRTSKSKDPYQKFSEKYLDQELKEEEVDDGSDDRFVKFLQDIYSKGDDEMKRAMVKSFTTSSGKVLSTNWEKVKDQ